MEELPTFVKVIGIIAVVGGLLLSALIFACKFWFIQMGAKALVKYVGNDRKTRDEMQYHTYGTPISEWKGKIPTRTPPSPPRPPKGRGRFEIIDGGLD